MSPKTERRGVPLVTFIIAEIVWRAVPACYGCRLAMTKLTDRIRRVTEDLHAIQSELSAAARPDFPLADRERLMQELVDANIVHEFKSAVDHMRHLLWSYIEASSGKEVVEKLQAVRMQRVTEMLRILKPSMHDEQMTKTPEATSFFDMIQDIASTAFERHQRSARPQ
jgi:hypothetical protein